MKNFGRVITAMITPFHDDGSVDFEGALTLANYLFDHGSDGLVVCGTTGESPTVDNLDKLKLYRCIAEGCGHRGTIIANTGSNNTARSVAFTKAAAESGVDAVMAVVPYYNKPNQEGMYLHFKAIAESVDLPVMLYNVPGRTGSNIAVETVRRLHEDCKNIAAIKEASGQLGFVSELASVMPQSFMIYSGEDSLTLPILSLGGCGVVSVSSHVAGPQIRAMIDAYKQGYGDTAMELHEKLGPVHKAMFVTTNPIPVKYAVRKMGLPAGPFHLPMCEPSEAEAAVIDKVLEEISHW